MNILWLEACQSLLGIDQAASDAAEYVEPVEFSPYFLSHSSSRLDVLASRLTCSFPDFSKARRRTRQAIDPKVGHGKAIASIRLAKTQAAVNQLRSTRIAQYNELKALLIQNRFDPESIAKAGAAKVVPVLFKLAHYPRALRSLLTRFPIVAQTSAGAGGSTKNVGLWNDLMAAMAEVNKEATDKIAALKAQDAEDKQARADERAAKAASRGRGQPASGAGGGRGRGQGGQGGPLLLQPPPPPPLPQSVAVPVDAQARAAAVRKFSEDLNKWAPYLTGQGATLPVIEESDDVVAIRAKSAQIVAMGGTLQVRHVPYPALASPQRVPPASERIHRGHATPSFAEGVAKGRRDGAGRRRESLSRAVGSSRAHRF